MAQHEPLAWAEELIEPARTVEHRRLTELYVLAAQCYNWGRVDDALRYAEACREAIDSGFDEVPHEDEGWLGGVYLATNQPERWVELCRDMDAHGRNRGAFGQAAFVLALAIAGQEDEATAASEGLLATARATDNPQLACYVMLCYAIVHRHTNPAAAYDVHRQGLAIAQESGNRQVESYHAGNLARLASALGEFSDALDYVRLAIRIWHDSGSFSIMTSALAILATVLDQLGFHESAATISEVGAGPFTLATYPEFTATITHLREVLGDDAYESFARIGTNMTNGARASYALDLIDQVRAGLDEET